MSNNINNHNHYNNNHNSNNICFSTPDGESMPQNWNVLLCNLQCAESPTHFLNISSEK